MKTALFLTGLLLPASLAGQSVAHSFAELNRRGALESGEKILITYAFEREGSYIETEARFESLTDTRITVKVDSLPVGDTSLSVRPEGRKHLVEIPQHRVSRIELPKRGVSRWVGGAIGAGAGGGASFLALLLCIEANEQGDGVACPKGISFYSPLA